MCTRGRLGACVLFGLVLACGKCCEMLCVDREPSARVCRLGLARRAFLIEYENRIAGARLKQHVSAAQNLRAPEGRGGGSGDEEMEAHILCGACVGNMPACGVNGIFDDSMYMRDMEWVLRMPK